MKDIIRKLFEADFMPHGHCYFWKPEIVWTNAISDSIIAIAYFTIPLALVHIVRTRKDFRYYWLLLLFATFILGCGATHVMDVINIWEPIYRLDSLIRVITAIASIGTAIMLVKITPSILLIPSVESFKNLNEELRAQIEMLEESNHFIQNLTAANPNKLYVYDLLEKKNIYSNKNIKDFPGCSPEELLDLNEHKLLQLIHPDDYPSIKEYFEQMKSAKDDEVRNIEYRMKIDADKYRWFYSTGKIFKRDEHGNILQIIGVIMETTEKKEAEEQLKQSQKFIEKITDTSPDTIYIINLNSEKIEYINQFSDKYNDKTIDEVIAMGMIHPEDISILKSRFKYKNFKNHEISTIEYRAKNPETGEWLWINAREIQFQKDNNGEVTHILGISRDITDLKKAHEELKFINFKLERKVEERTRELRIREQQLSTVTNSIPAFISYIDSNEYYLFANTEYKKLSTVSDHVEGLSIKEVLGEELYKRQKPYIDRAMQGEVQSFETSLMLKDNSLKLVDLNFIPDKGDKQVRGIVVMGVDHTERIKYEKALEKKNTELLKINKDLDGFIYTASHDLKAPISNMEGLIHFMDEETTHKYSPEENSYFEMLKISIEKLKNTIHGLSDISQLQRATNNEKELVSVKEVIDDFKIEHQHLFANTNIKLIEKIKEPFIKYSKKYFRSIIYNLLGNAIKYRSESRDPIVEIKTEKDLEGKIILSVKDNGLGLKKDQITKLFRMFRRFHTHVEGSGIGLYMVKRMIEDNGGFIEVESEIDKGSTFKIVF